MAHNTHEGVARRILDAEDVTYDISKSQAVLGLTQAAVRLVLGTPLLNVRQSRALRLWHLLDLACDHGWGEIVVPIARRLESTPVANSSIKRRVYRKLSIDRSSVEVATASVREWIDTRIATRVAGFPITVRRPDRSTITFAVESQVIATWKQGAEGVAVDYDRLASMTIGVVPATVVTESDYCTVCNRRFKSGFLHTRKWPHINHVNQKFYHAIRFLLSGGRIREEDDRG